MNTSTPTLLSLTPDKSFPVSLPECCPHLTAASLHLPSDPLSCQDPQALHSNRNL